MFVSVSVNSFIAVDSNNANPPDSLLCFISLSDLLCFISLSDLVFFLSLLLIIYLAAQVHATANTSCVVMGRSEALSGSNG